MQELTPAQLTRLEDISKKAASNASASLSKLIGIPVQVEMLRARAVAIDKLAAMLASPEERVRAVILPVTGEGTGSSALITTLQESRRLIGFVTKQSLGETETFDELSISAFKETGNIIGGAFLSALSNTVGISLVQAVPEFMTDTMQKVVDTTVVKLPDRQKMQSISFEIDLELRIRITTTVTVTDTIMTHYLFLLEFDLAERLLGAMGK